MFDGPRIALTAAMIGDPARANMLAVLMDGRALTMSELAAAAGVGSSTASEHLSRLEQAGLIRGRKQGRHRYFQLSGNDVAEVIERLMSLAERTAPKPIRTGPRDAALREARVCYDHLAGAKGVALLRGLQRRGWVGDGDPMRLSAEGHAALEKVGLDLVAASKGRRPLCRPCLDWSERDSHLAGSLGAALLSFMLEQGWVLRGAGRELAFTKAGSEQLLLRFA